MSTNQNQNQNQNPSPNPNPQPKKKPGKSFSDLLVEWDSLLDAVAGHGDNLARVDPYRAALADTLAKIKEAKSLQVSHRATKQRTTQQLKAMLLEGKDRAARLRGAIRAEMGTANEQLVQFGISPLRPRVTRSQQSATETVSPPAPQPELQATKAGQEAK
jgi:hypothetical protein